MGPTCGIDLDVVARNARAWAAFAGVPVRAVLKCDGYNWGAPRLAAALEATCEAFCVADADEFFALRPLTSLPIVVLGAVDVAHLRDVLHGDGRPTVATRDEVAIASAWAAQNDRPLRLRVGVLPAAGWSGLDLPALIDLAGPLAESGARVEVWTHVTGASASPEQIARFDRAVAMLRQAGVDVTGVDAGSTFSTADRSAPGSAVRIGVGLFGATGGPAVPGVANAIRLSGPVVRIDDYPAGTRIGYGERVLDRAARVATIRCGYGDGYPKDAPGLDDILSVGMQYTLSAAGSTVPGASVGLLDQRTNLDAFAANARRSVHEIVTTLGAAARHLEER